MTQSLLYPTVSNQFCLKETNWRNRREQATPVLNKILDEFVKQSKWTQQRGFLSIDAKTKMSLQKDLK